MIFKDEIELKIIEKFLNKHLFDFIRWRSDPAGLRYEHGMITIKGICEFNSVWFDIQKKKMEKLFEEQKTDVQWAKWLDEEFRKMGITVEE